MKRSLCVGGLVGACLVFAGQAKVLAQCVKLPPVPIREETICTPELKEKLAMEASVTVSYSCSSPTYFSRAEVVPVRCDGRANENRVVVYCQGGGAKGDVRTAELELKDGHYQCHTVSENRATFTVYYLSVRQPSLPKAAPPSN